MKPCESPFGAHVLPSKRFLRSWKQLAPAQQHLAKRKIHLLLTDPKHPSLHTHRLRRGKQAHTCYLTHTRRIIYLRKAGLLHLLDIGGHRCIDRNHLWTTHRLP
jgi:mRNA-degrading endonuclease RelE of RelBE toxin-antitoxin system